MCGYAWMNCGRCGKKPARPKPALEEVPGYCNACGHMNGPTAKRCKACGSRLGSADSLKQPAE